MNLDNFIAAIASASILISCAYLIWSRDYEDGLVGRIALGVMTIGAGVMFADAYYGELDLLPASMTILCGVAMFMVRHVWRFCRWRRSGSHSWRVANK